MPWNADNQTGTLWPIYFGGLGYPIQHSHCIAHDKLSYNVHSQYTQLWQSIPTWYPTIARIRNNVMNARHVSLIRHLYPAMVMTYTDYKSAVVLLILCHAMLLCLQFSKWSTQAPSRGDMLCRLWGPLVVNICSTKRSIRTSGGPWKLEQCRRMP